MTPEQRERLREAAEALCLKYTGSPEWCIGMDLLALLDALTSARERAERAEAERDEARQGERGMSEHVLHVATEANDAFAAAEALDEFWDVCGYPSNRGTLTPAEQVASITRERDAAEARVVELEEVLREAREVVGELLQHSIAHYGHPRDEDYGVGLYHTRARAILAQGGEA